MTIDEIRKITEENENKPDRWYDIFINEYILPAAKKGLHRVQVKTILPKHIDKLKKEGYILRHYDKQTFYNQYDHFDYEEPEYWIIEW